MAYANEHPEKQDLEIKIKTPKTEEKKQLDSHLDQ